MVSYFNQSLDKCILISLLIFIVGCKSNNDYAENSEKLFDLSLPELSYKTTDFNDYLVGVFTRHGLRVNLSDELVYIIKSDLEYEEYDERLEKLLKISMRDFSYNYNGDMKFSLPMKIRPQNLSDALLTLERNFSLKHRMEGQDIFFWFERVMYFTSAKAPPKWVWSKNGDGINGSGEQAIIHVSGWTRVDDGEFGFIKENSVKNEIYIFGSETFSRRMKRLIEVNPGVILN